MKGLIAVAITIILIVAVACIYTQKPPSHVCVQDVPNKLLVRCDSYSCGNYSDSGNPINNGDVVVVDNTSENKRFYKSSFSWKIESLAECQAENVRLADNQIKNGWAILGCCIGTLMFLSLLAWLAVVILRRIIAFLMWIKKMIERFVDRGNNINANVNLRTNLLPPGWYSDPQNPSKPKYWDGVEWLDYKL